MRIQEHALTNQANLIKFCKHTVAISSDDTFRPHSLGIEMMIAWIKPSVDLRQFRPRGTEKVVTVIGLHVIAY